MGNHTLELFKELGISPSHTRMMIYDFLSENKNHPTVDEIYQALNQFLPTLSKTTVYNVLNLLIKNDLVEAINTSDNEKRYELKIDDHSHFTCMECGTIFDIPRVETTYDKSKLPQFNIVHEQVNLLGVCNSCMKK